MSYRRSILLIVTIALLWISNAGASTIQAVSCSQADVQTAINAAVTGDIVNVPSGTCTWSTPVIIPDTKKITLQGAGVDSTIITKDDGLVALSLGASGSRVTGKQFINGYIIVDGDGWRIDHCKFYRASTFNEGVYVRGNRADSHPTGLVDSCVFYNTRVLVHGWAGELAHVFWSQPLNLGSGRNVVYVENNIFTATVHSNAVDGHLGGRYVFRYNTVNDTYLEAHSVQSNHRAVRSWEIYNNTINQKNRAMWVPMMLRGGTGVVFNNIVTGTWGLPRISLDNVRSCPDTRDFGTEPGWCTGSSRWDGNVANGYPCRDQIGRSTDQWLWTTSSPYPPQQLDPAYAWNNKFGTSDVTFYQHGCAQSISHIQPNRDYFDNTVKPGYAPYSYPHPLTYTWGTGTEPAPVATSTPTTTSKVISKTTNPKARFNR